MTGEILIKYKPFPKQKAFHDSPAKYRLLTTGVGFGKTAAGINEMIREAMQSPKGCLFALVAPTYNMLKRVTVREFFKFCPKECIYKYNRVEQVITLINGVEIIGVAGDREDTIDRIRGLTLAGAYGDEIAMCPEYMHEILVARMRDVKGNLKIWYTTTPRGFNWLYRIFVLKQKKDGTPIENPDDYATFTGSTLDNPYTPQVYKDNALGTYVGVFKKQEIYGEFVGFEGLVYMEFSRDFHVIDTSKIEFKRIIAGVDFGFTNPSAMLKIGFDTDDRAYIFQEFYEKHRTDQELAKKAKEKWSDVEEFIADSANPGGIQEFRNEGLNCRGVRKQTNENEKSFIMAGIKVITSLLQKQADGKARLYVDKRCMNTIMEFENYRYPDRKENEPEQEAPMKIFDHALDALRYAIGMKTGGSMKILSDPDNVMGLG